MPKTKYAVFSLDVEDWYHLDYFQRGQCDASQTMLDGLDNYLELLQAHHLPSSFFVLGELARQIRPQLDAAVRCGHDISSHGWSHRRPLTMTLEEFQTDLQQATDAIADVIGRPPAGYRAPCFSSDRARLEIVKNMGFRYDSSRIQFGQHPLYGTLDMSGFSTVRDCVFESNGFYEFEVSTLRLAGRHVPVSGGGYIRLFPWWFMSRLVRAYLRSGALYVLYIHPFELSSRPDPELPCGTGWLTRGRFSRGRRDTMRRLLLLIELLKQNGYKFTTFAALAGELGSGAMDAQ